MYKIDFNHPVKVYFVGIGGISMSGLAELLQDAGFTVSGSDRSRSELTEILESKGIPVFYGQRKENITPDIDVAVFTSAIGKDNPEYIAVRELGIPELSRAELIGQIMKNYDYPIAVSGTHGKTTTTSMISEVLLRAEKDPTLTVGGMLPSIGGNLRIGHSPYFVAEACEYTNSFLSFFPRIGLILNVEADHLDFFKDLEDIRHSFHRFAQLLPADGTLIIRADIPDYRELTEGVSARVITFGLHSTDAYGDPVDYYPEEISYDRNGCGSFVCRGRGEGQVVTLSVPGEHNILNALATIACADALAVDRPCSVKALADFHGADRRYQFKGETGGVTIIDDYAHHPTEIAATLKTAARAEHETLWVAFQPHTYTRTKALLPEFAEALSHADKIVLADIYAAREKNTIGISSQDLQREIQKRGKECYYFPSFEEIEKFLSENCRKGDLLITMGAGDIYKVGESLLGK